MNLRFLSLASGSSGNCYYLGNDREGILIDAGIGVRTIKRTLKEYQIPLESIMGILITHDHADHIKAAGYLGEKHGIPVYATERTVAGMNRNFCMKEKIYSAKRYICKEVPFLLAGFTITAFEVPHDGSDNVGYFVEYKGQTFAFATDLGSIPASVSAYLSRAHYLVIEANYDREMLKNGGYPTYLKERIDNPYGHLCNDDTADFLAKIYHDTLRYVFLCHLSKENNHPELAYKTVEYRLLQADIRVGRDLELVALKRNTPSVFYQFT